jgi:hypothetical protein
VADAFPPRQSVIAVSYCAFAATILSDDEVDERSKFDVKMFVAHEIVTLDAFKYPMISGHIGLVAGECILLLDYLRRSYFKFVLVIERFGDIRISPI